GLEDWAYTLPTASSTSSIESCAINSVFFILDLLSSWVHQTMTPSTLTECLYLHYKSDKSVNK
ncbi:MAG: hypothetical protein WBR24_25565, partial [Desulfobacterales bacterium]